MGAMASRSGMILVLIAGVLLMVIGARGLMGASLGAIFVPGDMIDADTLAGQLHVPTG